ncbi:MAG: tRNA (adenosine(37)-N6)-threonylcarbamoyltransferase complex dimerization subunit type 1 TsaB [Anaerolineales bacterium]
MLLALDTSTRRVGVALYDGIQVIHEMVWASNFYHTVELAPAVALTLQHARVGIDAVQALAVALGPGSFTSLRTGLALAKGIALARCLPIVGVPSLDFLAASQPVNDLPMAAVLEAGRKRLAVGWYEAADGRWQPTGKLNCSLLPT